MLKAMRSCLVHRMGAEPLFDKTHIITTLNFCLNFFFIFLSYKKKKPALAGFDCMFGADGNRTRNYCTCYGAPSALPLKLPPRCWWEHRESNPARMDFQSIALPYELCSQWSRVPELNWFDTAYETAMDADPPPALKFAVGALSAYGQDTHRYCSYGILPSP